jgi:hypothetical protein
MCYFITVGLQQGKSGAITKGAPRGLSVRPAVNQSILRYLPDSVSTFIVTKGGCSCGMFHEEAKKADEKDAIEKLRRKYQSRGWSPTKVERAISQYLANSTGKVQPCGLAPEVRSFLADLCNEVGELFVIVHWYHGDIEQERIELSMGPAIAADELRGTDLVTKADQVYRIVSYKDRSS